MFKGYCFAKEIILQAVYFKLTFSLSFRDLEDYTSKVGIQVYATDRNHFQKKKKTCW